MYENLGFGVFEMLLSEYPYSQLIHITFVVLHNVGLPQVCGATMMHSQQEQFGESVHHGNTHTVQATGDFVGVVVELTGKHM